MAQIIFVKNFLIKHCPINSYGQSRPLFCIFPKYRTAIKRVVTISESVVLRLMTFYGGWIGIYQPKYIYCNSFGNHIGSSPIFLCMDNAKVKNDFFTIVEDK
jgi:hypothetical protein